MASPSDDGRADWTQAATLTRPEPLTRGHGTTTIKIPQEVNSKRKKQTSNSHLPGSDVRKRRKNISTMTKTDNGKGKGGKGRGGKGGTTKVTPDRNNKRKPDEKDEDIWMEDEEIDVDDETMEEKQEERPKGNEEPKGVSFIFNNDDKISTAPNWKCHSLKPLLSEELYEASKVSYKDFFSEDPNEGHEAIKQITRLVGKMRWNVEELNLGQIATCLKEGHSTQQWFDFCIKIVGTDLENYPLTAEEIAEIRVILNRLAHTKPQVVMQNQIRKSKGPATNTTKAWHGAVNACGSRYACDEDGNPLKAKKTTQTSLKDSFQKQRDRDQATATKATTDTTKDTAETDQTRKKTSTDKKKVTRTHTVRVNLNFYVKAKDDQSAATTFFSILKDYFTRLQETDESTILLPWLDKNLTTAPAIDDADDLPKKITDLKPYTETCKIKNKSNVWFKIRIACNESPENTVSSNDSNNQDWFLDTDNKGYFCSVQESGNTTILGEFIYTAPFTDTVRLTSEIKKWIKVKTAKKDFFFGCRSRRNRSIKISDKDKPAFTDFALVLDQPVQIECDKSQAADLKIIFYQLFNKKGLQKHERPGRYDIRFLPDGKHVKSGKDFAAARIKTFKKHVAVLQSLSLFRSEDIMTLDTHETINGQRYTLREFIHSLTDPIAPNGMEKTQPLFHSVDFASQGRDKDSGTAYLTAYTSRATLAERAAHILPCLVNREFGPQAVKAWFQPTAMSMIHTVNFSEDVEGNWDGTWETPDDLYTQGILDEDMGVEVDFDDDLLQELQNRDSQMVTTTDALSTTSFGNALGAHAKDNENDSSSDDQSKAEASQAEVDKVARATASSDKAD